MPSDEFPLRPPLPLPDGVSEEYLWAFLQSVRVADAPASDLLHYCTRDFRRFVYTLGLARKFYGRALELGANPYFTTMLLREFTALDLTLANYFAEDWPSRGAQDVAYNDRQTGAPVSIGLVFDHFNIENDVFPYDTGSFDIVFFCEIIEHLLMDPLAALREIRRVLRPDGQLILITPNVSRLENVTKMVAGANLYDPYSGFGPYGRHNREYNRHELQLLLTYAGFVPEEMFTADVHPNDAYAHASPSTINPLVQFRKNDLGQYIFVRARCGDGERPLKPDFLYRSYAPTEIEAWPGPAK